MEEDFWKRYWNFQLFLQLGELNNMKFNYRKTASIVVLIIGAIVMVTAIITGTIHLTTQNETLRIINFISTIIAFTLIIIGSLLKPIKKN